MLEPRALEQEELGSAFAVLNFLVVPVCSVETHNLVTGACIPLVPWVYKASFSAWRGGQVPGLLRMGSGCWP